MMTQKCPLRVFDEQIVISQLADDTTIFVRDLDQIPKIPVKPRILKTKSVSVNQTQSVVTKRSNSGMLEEHI